MEESNITDFPDEKQLGETQAVTPSYNGVWLVLVLLIGFIVVGLGGYWLGMQSNKSTNNELSSTLPRQRPNPTKVAIPTPTLITQEVNQDSPNDWAYKSSETCGVSFALPPKVRPYYHPLDPNRPPSVTELEGSGSYWDIPRGGVYPNMLSKLSIWTEGYNYFQTQVNAMYHSDQVGGSGYIPSAVSVSCLPNIDNADNQQFLSSLNSGIQMFNQDEGEMGMQPDTYTVQSANQVNRWGQAVIDLTVVETFNNPGGEPYTNEVNYTIFATPDYLYEVRVLGETEDSFVMETAEEIFENLKFE